MEAVTKAQADTIAARVVKAPNPVDFCKNKVAVVIPAYNEERFIGSVVLKTLRFPVTVIVVDDGSSDDTALIAQAAGATVVRQPQNKGKGAAINAGLRKAREANPEAIVLIDGDGQHLPEQLPQIVRPVLEGTADVVVGSRYLDKTSDVPWQRILGHRFFNLATRLASGVAVSDLQSGYRAFSPQAFNHELFHSKGFAVEAEMQFWAHENRLRVAEVPITIRYADKPKRPVVEQGLRVLNGVLKLAGQYRPLLFFSIPGGIMLIGGIAWGLWVVDRYEKIHQLATGFAMLSVLLSIFGLIMMSTGFTLHSIRGLLLDMLRSHDKD